MRKLSLFFLVIVTILHTNAQITVTLKNIPYSIPGELTGALVDTITPNEKTEYYFGVVKDTVYFCEITSENNIHKSINKYFVALSDLGVSNKNWISPKIEKSNSHPHTKTVFYNLIIFPKDKDLKKVITIQRTTRSQPTVTYTVVAMHLYFTEKEKAEAALEMLRKLANKK